MTRPFDESKHPRGHAGQFTETTAVDPGSNVLTLERPAGTTTGLDTPSQLTAAQAANAATYNDRFDMWCPLTVGPDGDLSRPANTRDMWCEELGHIDCDSDGQVSDDHEQDWVRSCNQSGWEPVTGFTRQYGYRGPIMHASEQLAGGMARALAATPGTYVVVPVETLPEDEHSDFQPVGWALLRHIDQ